MKGKHYTVNKISARIVFAHLFSVISVQLVMSSIDGASHAYQLPEALSRACLGQTTE